MTAPCRWPRLLDYLLTYLFTWLLTSLPVDTISRHKDMFVAVYTTKPANMFINSISSKTTMWVREFYSLRFF